MLVAAILWGTTGTAATFAPHAGPLAIGAAAMGLGGLLQALIAGPQLRRDRVLLRGHPVLIGVGALAVAVYPLAFYAGMHLAGVAVGTVVALASGPIFAAILERAIDRTPLDARWFAGAGLGIAGTVLLAFGGHGGAGGSSMLGVALALLAGLAYAVYTWAARRLMAAGCGSRSAMGAVFGIGGILLLPVLAATGGPFLQDPRDLAVGAYMAIVPMFLGYLAFGAGLRTVPARTATVLTLAEPAVAAVLAWAVVGERLGGLGWAGIALIALSLVVFSLPRARS
ncbi:EamA family transporter [Leucobacter iarius]|uniref:EamA family transporter n=1 Tax=Leucobacter iarius TaxID=333963 RepID=A0ABN2L6S6_9MICO